MISRWNNGNLEVSSFRAKRARVRHQVKVDVPAEKAFAPVSFMTAPGWLDQWQPRLLYTESGRNEDGALWTEAKFAAFLFNRPGLETIWYTTLFDAENHRFQAYLANGDLAAGRLGIEMNALGDAGTDMIFDFCYTALSARGNQLFDAELSNRMFAMLESMGMRIEKRATESGAGDGLADATSDSELPWAKRERVVHDVILRERDLAVDPDRAFSLVCPIAEQAWIDPWFFDLIYSDSGKNESDCIWVEPFTGPIVMSMYSNTVWYTTLLDFAGRRLHAVLKIGECLICRFVFEVIEPDDGQGLVRWTLTYTGLNAKGNAIMAEGDFRQRASEMPEILAIEAEHYLRTGKKYRFPIERLTTMLASRLLGRFRRHVVSTFH